MMDMPEPPDVTPSFASLQRPIDNDG